MVVGFPLNATRTAAPGYIEGNVTAQGRDIYDQRLLTRTYEVLEVNVNPGNSGSPVLVGGDVAGVVESKSLSEASTAYAIPDSIVVADLARAGTCLLYTSQATVLWSGPSRSNNRMDESPREHARCRRRASRAKHSRKTWARHLVVGKNYAYDTSSHERYQFAHSTLLPTR